MCRQCWWSCCTFFFKACLMYFCSYFSRICSEKDNCFWKQWFPTETTIAHWRLVTYLDTPLLFKSLLRNILNCLLITNSNLIPEPNLYVLQVERLVRDFLVCIISHTDCYLRLRPMPISVRGYCTLDLIFEDFVYFSF